MKKKITFHALLILVFFILFANTSIGYADETPIATGDNIVFGHYEQDNNVQNSAEPIEWQVLSVDKDRALLISLNALEAISYSTPMDSAAYSASGLSWETSYLRSWLNSDFLNAAFSADEQKAILLSELSLNDANGNSSTKDSVFCLSISEAETFFADASAMACYPTEAAKSKLKLDSGAVTEEGYALWWLRNMTSAAKPAKNFDFMSATYNEAGYISGSAGLNTARSGKGMPVFCNYLCAVRPAMWVSLDALTSLKISVNTTDEASAVEAMPQYAVLEKGARGEDVKALQERLNELHYDLGAADGAFGAKTESAVKSFQKINDLEITGIADPNTQTLLFSDNAIEGPVIRKLNSPFSIDNQELTLTSVGFANHHNYGDYRTKPQDGCVYLCVKLTLTNKTGHSICSNINTNSTNLWYFDAFWNDVAQYGSYAPAKATGYSALLWGLTDNYITSGESIDMVYLINVPTEAQSTGSLTLEFTDGSSYIVR